jgi:3-hydroxybutyryl-CoA dehydratase
MELIMKFTVGETASIERKITQADIDAFAHLVGDTNPVHVDEEAAKKSRFGRRIAHGMWGASLISAVLGTKLPGPGTIYLSQTLKFMAPIYADDIITAKVKVLKIREDKPIITMETICMNQRQEIVITGEAVGLMDS